MHRFKDAEQRVNPLLFGLILTMPLGVTALTNLLLAALLIHSFVFLKGPDWLSGLKNPIYLVSGVFYLYYASTIFWADNVSDGLAQLETKLSLLVYVFVVAANARWLNRNHLKQLKWALVYGALASMIIAFGYAIFRSAQYGSTAYITEVGTAVSYFTYTELSSPLMHVGYLSTFVGVAIITLLDELVINPRNRVRNALLLLALLFYMFMLQGRMNVLALIIISAVAFIFYVFKYRNFKWLLLPILPVVLIVLLFPFLPESVSSRYLQMPNIDYDISADASAFNSATYRFAEWKGAFQVIGEHTWFGTGVGDNRQSLIDAYDELGFHVGVDRRYNAHNQFLETWIAAGLIGLLLLFSLFGTWLYWVFRFGDYSTLFAMLFFMLCMLTESMLERAWAVVFMAIYFPVMLFSNFRADAVKKKL